LAAEAYHRTETLYPFPQWQAAALYQAGQCYEQLRRDRDAENVYRQLLREHAQCSLAARAQERLEQLSTRLEIEAPRPPQAAGGSR
jgi:TolA-binding protein